MKLSGSLWWSVMRSEFIVGDWKLRSRSIWMFSNSDSVIVFSFTSSKNPSSSASSLMCYSCTSIRLVSSFVFSIGIIWSYGSSKQTDFTLVWQRSIVYLGGDGLDVSVFFFKSLDIDQFLLFFLRRCYLAAFLLMNNGHLKGHVSNFPSFCINNSLTPLLLSPHPRNYSFRNGI